MKTSFTFFEIMCTCWLFCSFLCGCASDQSKPASVPPNNPDSTAPGQNNAVGFATMAAGASPLFYQWYVGTNTALVTNAGQTATFTVVAATNGGPLYYQWQFNGTNISGVSNH